MTRRLALDRPELPRGIVAIPVRTPLVQPGEDFIALVGRCVQGIARAGDVLALSETAVAIAQGRIIAADRVRPTALAYMLARHAGTLSSTSQPESLQLIMDEVGAWKVVYASAMNVVGRLVGRRGLFYEIMGEAITAIDGYTGTLRPFERMIVFSPDDPAAFARTVSQ